MTRRALLLPVALILAVGCQAVPTPSSPPTPVPPTQTAVPKASRLPLSAGQVKAFAAEFERIAEGQVQAWNSHDLDRLRQVYTEDVVHYDANQPLFVGIDAVLGMASGIVFAGSPDFQGRLGDTFIRREDGFDRWEIWNWHGHTKDDPIKEYDWLTMRDGRISYWRLLYGPAFLKIQGASYETKLLEDYASVWSSGDVQRVAGLYASAAVRLDTLFGENQEGSSAVQDYAEKFFAWYPGVRLELLETFAEGPIPVKRGGVYAIHVQDSAGKPCDIKALIVMEADESKEKITKEWVFYQPDSLLACGWAR